MARFSPAVMASIRNREALAKALDEQERDIAFRNMLYRGLTLAAPIAATWYFVKYQEHPLIRELSGLFSKKNVVARAEKQGQNSRNVMVASSPTPPPADEISDATEGLDARNVQMQKIVNSVPKVNLTEAQVMEMSRRAEQNGEAKNSTEPQPTVTQQQEERKDKLDEASDADVPTEKK